MNNKMCDTTIPIKSKLQVQDKQDLIMKPIIHFFEDKDNLDQFLDVIYQRSDVSLRILDWFVTNYAKGHSIVYDLDNDNDGEDEIIFNVFKQYKDQLKAYSKKYFDPFCRRERIDFYIDTDESIETTVAQLNFFRWAIKYGVLDYVEEHKDLIEKDMESAIDASKAKKLTLRKNKMTITAAKLCTKHYTKVIVSFD